MIYNSSTSHLKEQKSLAKSALNELRTSDNAIGRPLAFCLMFETVKNQLLAGSVLNLAIALDAALHIPSEPLLAAIRIQWWADALASKTDQNVPLVARLQSQYLIFNNFRDQLQEMVGEWQVACNGETRDSSAGWATGWRLAAYHLGHIKGADQAAIIGRELHSAMRGQRYAGRADIIDIKSLRQNDQQEKRSWLFLSACLLRKLQRRLDSDLKSLQINQHLWLDDPMLAWRILGWHIFGPPQ